MGCSSLTDFASIVLGYAAASLGKATEWGMLVSTGPSNGTGDARVLSGGAVVRLNEKEPLDRVGCENYSENAMGRVSLMHQVWFAYYFTSPALLAGHWVLRR